jgi:hypothetical protein
LFWLLEKRSGGRHDPFSVYALRPHTVSAACSGPVYSTTHLHTVNAHTAKPPARGSKPAALPYCPVIPQLWGQRYGQGYRTGVQMEQTLPPPIAGAWRRAGPTRKAYASRRLSVRSISCSPQPSISKTHRRAANLVFPIWSQTGAEIIQARAVFATLRVLPASRLRIAPRTRSLRAAQDRAAIAI